MIVSNYVEKRFFVWVKFVLAACCSTFSWLKLPSHDKRTHISLEYQVHWSCLLIFVLVHISSNNFFHLNEHRSRRAYTFRFCVFPNQGTYDKIILMQNWLNVILLFVDPSDCTLEELINKNPKSKHTYGWWYGGDKKFFTLINMCIYQGLCYFNAT